MAAAATTGEGKPPRTDPTLQDPHCVYQLLRKHFRRYTPQMVAEVCGVAPDDFQRVCDVLCAASGRERTAAFCYAVGWTQHTVGVQYIRTATIIQLLLGNIGRPGGGILALRGHASIQGSTDIPTLYDLLPGYLPMPEAGTDSLADYVESNRSEGGFWANLGAYTVSLLKSWWGDAATVHNDYCFDRIPRLTGDHSVFQHILGMFDGTVRGYFLLGENPAVGSADGEGPPPGAGQARLARRARPRRDRERDVLARRARRSSPASSIRRRGPRRCSSSRPRRTSRRTARSPTPSACCSGTTRPSNRRATPAPTCGSPTTSGSESGPASPTPVSTVIVACST